MGMEKICILNFREIEDKNALVDAFMKTNLSCHYENKEDFIKKMNQSKPKKLPQYYFMFEGDNLIGQFFLGKSGLTKASWYAIDNTDELPTELAKRLLDVEEKVFMEFGINDGLDYVASTRKSINENVEESY